MAGGQWERRGRRGGGGQGCEDSWMGLGLQVKQVILIGWIDLNR